MKTHENLKDLPFGSDDLKELVKHDIEHSGAKGPFLIFAYTDFGGSVLDITFIEYLKERYPYNIVHEAVVYNGQNGIVFNTKEFPDLVERITEETDGYLLGFEDIEDCFSQLEHEAREKSIEWILGDRIDLKDEESVIMEWLCHYGSWETSGIDFCWSDFEDRFPKPEED